MKTISLAIVAALGGAMAPALGQTAGPSGADQTVAASSANASNEGQLEEIIVTAQKYQQDAFDVPISLSVLTSQDLQRNNITSITDLQYHVPGLWVQNGGPQRRITMDGVSNLAGSGSLVGLYVDDADLTADGYVGNYGYGQPDILTYDMARVEVLRGPQGTLYGDGSMGGTIHFVTNKPVLNRFELGSDVAAEFTEDGEPSQRVDMMINAPLVGDTLGLRVAGGFQHEGGWVDEPVANAQNINDENIVNVRAMALWQPTENLGVTLMQTEYRNEYGIGLAEDSSGNFTQYFNQATIPHGKQSYEVSNATVTYDFGGAQLVSATTYFNFHNDNINWGEIIPVFGVAYDVYIPDYPTKEESLSEELRVSRTGQGPWQWTIGYFYKHFIDAADYGYYFNTAVPPGTPLSDVPFYPADENATADRDVSSAAFADTSYRVLRSLTIGVGARYYSDSVNFLTSGSAVQTGTFSSTDPRAYVRYELTDDVNVYASAAKGFRSGGFNAQGQPSFEPESVWTYDLGTKTRFLDGRLSLDADVYLSNYSGYDIVGFNAADPVNFTQNGGTARLKGVNVDLDWRPSDAWKFGISGNYVNARFVSISAQNVDYNVGDPVPTVLEYLVTGSGERDFVWGVRPAFLRLEYSQVGPSTDFDRQLGDFFFGPVIHMLNFNVGVQWNESVQVSAYAQNLTNDRGYLNPDSQEGLAPRQRPRTVGVEFVMKLR